MSRADAVRNRARVLAAADAVFGEKGATASTEEVAARAGVGIATVFRHFPTKQGLLEAIVLARLERLLAVAESLVAEGGDGFATLFALFVEEAVNKRVFGDVLTHAGEGFRTANTAIVDGLWAAFATLIARGQAAGQVRPGFDVDDVQILLAGAHQALQRAGDDPARRARLLAILLDGVRGH